jgi:tetratricopeptide (TPR) repeat protein
VNAILWALFFLLLFILLFCTTSSAGSNGKLDRVASLTIDANQQFEFAQHHFTAKAYGMAVIEYQRFIYFFPEDERVALALYNIGMSYYSTNRFQEAIASFEKVIDQHGGTDLSVKSYYMKSKSLTKLNASGSAVINLQNLIAITDDINVKDEAYYQIGWIYLYMASWRKAAAYFAKISPQNADKYKLDKLAVELEKKRLIPKKSPEVAGLLSIIPGGGYLYCERYQDALISFLLNGALIYAAYESFDEGHNALGGLISFVGFGFYAGNIYGAITSAHKYNRNNTDRFLKNLNDTLKVNLLVNVENQGASLVLQWAF